MKNSNNEGGRRIFYIIITNIVKHFKREKTVTSNTRISNLEKFDLELISNLVGVWVVVVVVCVWSWFFHDYRGCYVIGDAMS